MKSLSDQELLREYVERRSEPAFTELVHRHVDLVYSCALRIVRDPHLAQDVTQSVFTAAAQNAPRLAEHPVVVGWLHRTTQNLAANAVRHEVRRREREQKATVMNEIVGGSDAWECIEPHIEEALGTLKDQDRELMLLRYFQGKSAREIADVIGTSEETAQKRVNRALERIRKFLAERSITAGTVSLGIALSTRAVKAAPMGLADTVSRAVAQAVVSQVASATVAQGFVMTTTQKAIIGASLALAVGTGIYEVQQSSERQREAVRSARALTEIRGQFDAVRRERDAALAEVQAVRDEAERLKREAAEVHRLRGEVTELRGYVAKSKAEKESPGIAPSETALIAWLDRTDAFKQSQYRLPDKSIPEIALLNEEDWLDMAKKADDAPGDASEPDDPESNRRKLRVARQRAKMKFGFLLNKALDRYRNAHDGLLPTDTRLLRPFFEDREPHLGGSAQFVSDAMLDRYQMLQTGTFESVPSETVIVAEIAPADEGLDTRLVIGKHWLQTAGEGDAAYWNNSSSSTP